MNGRQDNFQSVSHSIKHVKRRLFTDRCIASNTTIFEFNPWELGSWDPTTYAFAPMDFIGSNFIAGILPDNETCISGFDNAGFIMGTSSSLFNQALLQINNTAETNILTSAMTSVLGTLNESNSDIAIYKPNPFYHFHNETNENAPSELLTLVDGGEDLQNIPLHPLLQPQRRVDVIFAIDSSADTTNRWPNGTSLVATYQRSVSSSGIANGTVFRGGVIYSKLLSLQEKTAFLP